MPKSKKPTFQRARQPAQIEHRCEAILQAAIELFDELGLENVRLIDIADRVGIAKSNLYRYFESREHIYLRVFQQEGAAWEERATADLEKLAGTGSIPKVARAIASAFAKSDRYCVLMGNLTSVMEQRLSLENVVNFRQVFFDRRRRFAQVLSRAIPEIPTAEMELLIMSLYAFVTGIWPLSHSPKAPDISSRPELRHLDFDFEKEMIHHIELLLAGALCHRAGPTGGPTKARAKTAKSAKHAKAADRG